MHHAVANLAPGSWVEEDCGVTWEDAGTPGGACVSHGTQGAVLDVHARERCTEMGEGIEFQDDAEHDDQDPPYTTVMLRNIPNKYTQEMLVEQLELDFAREFDFIYLPTDFKNRCNMGYAFINFRSTGTRERFVTAFNGLQVRRCLPGVNSSKIVEVMPARIQGLERNVRRLRNSPAMTELVLHPEWMPLLFDEAGRRKPFPAPNRPLQAVKMRRRVRDESLSEPVCLTA